MLPRRQPLFHREDPPLVALAPRTGHRRSGPLAAPGAPFRAVGLPRPSGLARTRCVSPRPHLPGINPMPRNSTTRATFQAQPGLTLGFVSSSASARCKVQRGYHSTMKHTFRWRHMHKPVRDFVCALVVFSALFVVMSPARHDAAPIIPVLSMFSGATATASDYRPAAGAARPSAHDSVRNGPLPSVNMPLISTMLALVFSSIMAFNLALLRHLRRVNASSRRSAWKEG